SLARDLLNHTPKEAIAEIRVGVTSARIKVERLAEHPSDDLRRRRGRFLAKRFGNLARLEHRVPALVTVPARRVVKQMAKRDTLPTVVERSAFRHPAVQREQLEHGIVERHLALLAELQHRDAGDRLREAGDAKERVRLCG